MPRCAARSVSTWRAKPGAIARAIETGNRRAAGITAPPEGLYLEEMALDVEESGVFEP